MVVSFTVPEGTVDPRSSKHDHSREGKEGKKIETH